MLSSKFSSLENYYSSTSESTYSLLPCRFTPLDNYQNYLVSNDVGEHLVLNRESLHQYLNKQLTPDSAIYKELQSKHFIYDEDSKVALELLSLKYRTKASVFSSFTALHIFVVTLRCDYSCPYCQVSRQSSDKEAFDMKQETAMKALELVFKSPSPQIKIEFQGGESLLNFDLIQTIVFEAEKMNVAEKRDLQFVIATNLTPLNEQVLKFCLDHDIFISTSLDGSQDLHDANRPRKGESGYQLTLEGIQRVQKYLGKDRISALMTTTELSLKDVKAIIDEYMRLELDGIFLRPLSPYGFAVKTKQIEKYDAIRWLDFYKEGLDYIIDVNRRGCFFPEHYTALILKKMFSALPAGYVDLQSPTGAGISAVVYNYDGDVYASDEARMLAEMGDKSFRIGNVNQDSYEEIFASDVLLDVIEESVAESCPQCSECAFLPFCGTDPVYHYATQKDIVGHKAFSGFCTKNMSITKHIIDKLQNDSKARDVLMSWI
ncbi:MAG: His-Xaa-Ser system radical SAM maturase HxsB [Flavobacteriales bacterium]|nr:His-Xaa-Ser system radical SAM maturase HxsB [Flavobacteriales bacterium]